MKLLAARSGNKVDYSRLSSLSGLNRQKIASYIQLLEQTYLIYQLSPFTKNIDREISQQKKLNFSDTGLINILSENRLSSGQVFENAVAAQLKPLGELQYYQKKTGQEINFIFRGEMAIEVKETPTVQDMNTLSKRADSLQIEERALVGRRQPLAAFDGFTWAGAIW